LAEIKPLRSMIADKKFGLCYLVVTGEQGVGKTCLLDTVTSKNPGEIKVEASPSDAEHTIVENVLHELAGMEVRHISAVSSVNRVICWHRFFTLGRFPIVVIDAVYPGVGQDKACLTGAVRTLVDNYKLRVVVEGSPNPLDETRSRTKRTSAYV
jgi:hypothetical protein